MSPVVMSSLTLGAILMLPATLAAGDVTARRPIEVFTISGTAIDTASLDAKVFFLDGLVALTHDLSHGLPADPDAARRMALQRISELGDGLQSRAQQAVEGLSLAHRYDIRKLPAVVFDAGQTVIYGVTNLDEAAKLYRQGGRH